MLADLDRFKPHASVRLFFDKLFHEVMDNPRGRFAPHCGHDAKIDEAAIRQLLKRRQAGVVTRDQHGVVEHMMQPGAYRLETTEIKAPVAVVQVLAGEHEM